MEQCGHSTAEPTDSGSKNLKDACEVFSSAVRSFRESLPEPERDAFREFESSETMIEEIQAHCQGYYKNRSTLMGCCRRIRKFARAWEPFFEITNIFVSSHPDWAAIAWGAVRLVFVVGWSMETG